MESIGAFEAETRFSELLERAGRGECTMITKRGEPEAMLVPIEPAMGMTPAEAIDRLAELREELSPLDGATIRELVNHGRQL